MADSSRMISVQEALAMLRRERVMTLVPCLGVRSLVGEIIGGPVKGSWWGHARGAVVYHVATALEESDEVLVAKLVQGKVTFIHESLWPALFRVVRDDSWRRKRARGLSKAAGRLWKGVERAGELQLDALPEWKNCDGREALKRAKLEIEKRALAQVASIHTASGRHATVMRSWDAWVSPRVRVAAQRLAFGDAFQTLVDHKIIDDDS